MGETWAPYLGNFECLAAPRSTNKGGEEVRFHSDRIMVILRPLRRKGHRKRLKWSPTMYAGNIRTLLWEINQSRTGADKVEGWPKAGRLPPGVSSPTQGSAQPNGKCFPLTRAGKVCGEQRVFGLIPVEQGSFLFCPKKWVLPKPNTPQRSPTALFVPPYSVPLGPIPPLDFIFSPQE